MFFLFCLLEFSYLSRQAQKLGTSFIGRVLLVFAASFVKNRTTMYQNLSSRVDVSLSIPPEMRRWQTTSPLQGRQEFFSSTMDPLSRIFCETGLTVV